MFWPWFIIGTVCALLIAVYMTWLLRRNIRLKKVKPLTYEELSSQREFLYFSLNFFAFWCLITASKIDWHFWGYFTIPLVAAFLVIVLVVTRWAFRRMDRSKSAQQEILQKTGKV
jgi:bacteriorhodopsin